MEHPAGSGTVANSPSGATVAPAVSHTTGMSAITCGAVASVELRRVDVGCLHVVVERRTSVVVSSACGRLPLSPQRTLALSHTASPATAHCGNRHAHLTPMIFASIPNPAAMALQQFADEPPGLTST